MCPCLWRQRRTSWMKKKKLCSRRSSEWTQSRFPDTWWHVFSLCLFYTLVLVQAEACSQCWNAPLHTHTHQQYKLIVFHKQTLEPLSELCLFHTDDLHPLTPPPYSHCSCVEWGHAHPTACSEPLHSNYPESGGGGGGDSISTSVMFWNRCIGRWLRHARQRLRHHQPVLCSEPKTLTSDLQLKIFFSYQTPCLHQPGH